MRNVSHYPGHRFVVAAAFFVVACVPVSAATWKPVNTGLPSTSTGVLTITIDPMTPSTLYAITTTKTIFKSADDGASWNAVSGLTGVNALAIDPKDSSTMYVATTHGIFKTGDRGGNWAGVYAGLTTTYILAVVIDPGTPSTIYAIAGNSEILKSTDEGASWNPITTGPWTPRTPQPISITVDPVNPSTTYVVAWDGSIFKSTNGGASWSAIKAGPAQTGFTDSVLALTVDPVTPSTLYAGSFADFQSNGGSFHNGVGSISKSGDGGQTWHAIRSGIPSDAFVRSLTIDPTAPSIIYGSYSSSANGRGILKSVDGGQTWSVMTTGVPSGSYIGSPVAINPTMPGAIYAGYSYRADFDTRNWVGGLVRSTDAGQNWTSITTGLAYFDVRVLAIDRADRSVVYAGGAGGVFKSVDTGTSWTNLSAFRISTPPFPPDLALPPFGPMSAVIRSLLISPASPNIFYAEAERVGQCLSNDNVLFKSADGGATWSDTLSPPASGCVLGSLSSRPWSAMAVDPTDQDTLYLGTTDDANGEYSLLKSNDGGASWHDILDARNGLEAGVNALVIDPVNSAVLYAGTGPTSYDATAGLFKSLDAGASWSNIGFEKTAVTVLTMDRTDPGTLYASTEGYNPTGFRGLFKTGNGGATWSTIGNGLEPLTGIGATITALVIAPDNPDTLYAATSGDGVYKSPDGGLNWTKSNDGLKSLDVRALALAPGTPVYAATSGGVFTLVD